MVYVLLTSMPHPLGIKGAIMGSIFDYRATAAAHRVAARQEHLPNRRAMHERAARLCDEMADRAEKRLQRVEERVAAKAQRDADARARQRRRSIAGLRTSHH